MYSKLHKGVMLYRLNVVSSFWLHVALTLVQLPLHLCLLRPSLALRRTAVSDEITIAVVGVRGRTVWDGPVPLLSEGYWPRAKVVMPTVMCYLT